MNAATPVFTGLLLIAITSISHAEVSLTVRLAGGVCRQYKQWKTTKQLPAPLKTKSAQVQTASIKGCKVLQKTACADSSDCQPFSCVGGASSNTRSQLKLDKGNYTDGREPTEPPPPPPPPPDSLAPPNTPGSQYGNPNNPKNMTDRVCTSTKNPYNKWPSGRRRRRRRRNDEDPGDNEIVEEEDPTFIGEDKELQGYLKSMYSAAADRISGGGAANASDNLFPYQARIAFVEKKCYWDHTKTDQNKLWSRASVSWHELRRCTGTVFNRYYVLTSSQCCNWLAKYRVAWQNPNLKWPAFQCDVNKDPFCPRVPESYQHLTNLSDIFIYFGEFSYITGEQWNRERRSMRSVQSACLWNKHPLFSYESVCVVELFAYIVYKPPSFYPLLLPNPSRGGGSGQPAREGKPFKSTNGEIRALFIGWGNTNGDKLEWSNYLQYVKMRIIPRSQRCRKAVLDAGYFPEAYDVENTVYCAELYKEEFGKKNALCRGDVGGPLICETESGHERLCGMLASLRNVDKDGKLIHHDQVLCEEATNTYVFINMTTPHVQDTLFEAISWGIGKAFGWVYRNNRSNWQDEISHSIVRNSAFRRKFEVPWNTLTTRIAP